MHNLKKLFIFVIAGLLCTYNCLMKVGAVNESEDDFIVSELSLNYEAIEIATGETIQLSAVSEFGDSITDILWQSSDESVASVDEGGSVNVLRYGKAVITATDNRDPSITASCTVKSKFFDVNDSSKYYSKPVYWAAEKGITTGYDKVYFGPQQNCTRRELSIFLWRLAGKPAVSGSLPFSDTKGYKTSTDTYKAILWCYKNGIVKGYGDGTFKPDASIVRKDTMIMLYRLAGKPQVSGSMKFGDVKALNYPSTSDTYKSIIWGTNKKITNGYSDGSFKPLENCLREHIVTFIYRYNKLMNPGDVTSTVTFDSNGGSAVKPVTVENGETVSAPETPERDGYIFAGWYTSEDYDEAFLFDEEAVDEDVTLYAAWKVDDEDALLVEYAANQIDIIYQQGDNAENVTRDIILPTEVEGIEDVTITWHSSNAAISSEGTVTRPESENTAVTMTVTAEKNDASFSVDHSLVVIHEHEREISGIPNNSAIDIENMNQDEDAEITYNEDRTQITSIEGKYSDIVVENSDDALDVIQSIHTVVGINNPYEELDLLVQNKDEYGAEYTFEQDFNGSLVFGRRITVSVDADGITDSLSSGVYASNKLAGINTVPSISAGDAEAYVAGLYGGDCAVNSGKTVLTIYTLDEYEETPVLAYMVYVSGKKADGKYVDNTVFVSAETSEIVKTYTNISDASAETGSGKDEFGNKVSFPVAFTWTDWYFYYMQDLNRDIQMYNQLCYVDFRIGSEFNNWSDKTAVSAYTNLIKTYDWYNSNLGRRSVDGNGLHLKTTVHNDHDNDNAFWSGSDLTLNFCDNKQVKTSRTTASGLDIVGHEFTHGVVQFTTGGLVYENAPGAINEGYADIFGCLIDGDWQMGEDWLLIRDASNPTKYEAPDKLSSPYYFDFTKYTDDDNGGVHTNSSLVYHAAYLMTKYGMSRSTLAKLWYKSLSMGYDNSATFQTVRRNVLKAAKKINLSNNQINIIKRAFDDVEIYGPRGDLNVTVTDAEGNLISNAEVTVVDKGLRLSRENNAYKYTLDEGTYSLNVSADGYVEYNANFEIKESETTNINVVLVHEGRGLVNGTVVSATSALTLEGVQLNVRSGMNVTSGSVIASSATDENGRYSFELNSGYYTIEMILEGFTTGYTNVQIDGGATAIANASLSPIMSGKTYRVVLTWGESPSDLDSHLAGHAADGTNFHIYYSNKASYRSDGTEIGNLDVDDTTSYGPETTTFSAETEGVYYFYVHRYSSDGSMPASGATVVVYNGDNMIARYTIDSTAPSDSLYWNIFKIENGIFYTVNTVSNSVSTSGDAVQLLQASVMDIEQSEKAVSE